MYQTLLNGTRLGLYEPIRNTLQSLVDDSIPEKSATNTRITRVNPDFWITVLAGGLCGIVGAFVSSPLFLVKTRMQSYAPILPGVGQQHSYVTKGTFSALLHIYRLDKISGLWAGASASCMRTGVGSAVQLSSYETIKNFVIQNNMFGETSGHGGLREHFGASLVTGFFVCIFMNPFDLVATRLYNQNKGSLYSGPIDCLMKTVKSEGLLSMYKGFTAQFLRVGCDTHHSFCFRLDVCTNL